MKARTEYQRTVLRLSNSLRPLSEARKKDAQNKCGIIYSSRWESWCACCGHVFPAHEINGDNPEARCPHCGALCKLEYSPRKQVSKERYYYTVLEVRGENQVIRNYLAERFTRKGKEPAFSVSEAFRVFISPKGEKAVMARPVMGLSVYYDAWRFGEPMALRDPSHARYQSYGDIGRGIRLMPELHRRHIKALWPDDNPGKQIIALLKYPTYETLFKAKEEHLSNLWLYHGYKEYIESYWASIKVALRHGFKFDSDDKARTWMDMVRMMRNNGYDLLNPLNVAPGNLQAKHDEALRRDRRRIELQRKIDEANRAKALSDEKNVLNVEYRKRLGNMLNVVISVGDLTIRPLQNILEFYNEGTEMHHCVYSNHYYDRPHTVIFAVRKGDERVSTLEWDTSTLRIIQNRAKYNGVPKFDKEVRQAILSNKEILKLSRTI